MFRNQCVVCGASLVSDKARTCGPKCAKEARQPKGMARKGVSPKKCSKCGAPSVPGLRKGVALCQYHFDVHVYGQAWADTVHPLHMPPPKAKD